MRVTDARHGGQKQENGDIHGSRTGNGEFAVTFVGLEYGVDEDTGALLGTSTTGTYKVRANITLINEAQQFTGPFKTEVFDLNGNLLFSVDGTVTGKRIGVEPL